MHTSRRGAERIGHRGAPREFPENTLPSFSRAIELGADGIELDVHVTADGVAVVHHDSDVATENGRAKRPIVSMTAKQVSDVELAPNVFVPTLAQVLSLASAKAVVYVELKGRDTDARFTASITPRSPARPRSHRSCVVGSSSTRTRSTSRAPCAVRRRWTSGRSGS
jgi:glycerophosphoryl diester phosphodiesterase